jgi:hypothetical protein
MPGPQDPVNGDGHARAADPPPAREPAPPMPPRQDVTPVPVAPPAAPAPPAAAPAESAANTPPKSGGTYTVWSSTPGEGHHFEPKD